MGSKAIINATRWVAFVALAISSRAEAVGIYLDVSSTELSYEYFEFGTTDNKQAYSVVSADFSTATSGFLLDVDFATDKTLSVTFQAPVGQEFQVTPPASAQASRLDVTVTSAASVSNPTVTEYLAASDVTYTGLMGTAPTFTVTGTGINNAFVGSLLDDEFYANYLTDTPLPAFSFSAITVAFTVPDDYKAEFVAEELFKLQLAFTAAGAPYNSLTETNPFPDPGQWVTIGNTSAAPEPTTLALFGLGLAAIPFVRRRRTPA